MLCLETRPSKFVGVITAHSTTPNVKNNLCALAPVNHATKQTVVAYCCFYLVDFTVKWSKGAVWSAAQTEKDAN